jgi:uncharacterized damage-inducible protein DinB
MHPLIEQLRFTRSEFERVFEGVSEEDARKRLLPMNCLSWIIAHLALQEQRYWIQLAQGRDAVPHPELMEVVGYPDRATTPELPLARTIWRNVTAKADEFLDTVDEPKLLDHFELDGQPVRESVGTMLHRNVYHYWFHTGEAHAIRQQLGHGVLPDFVGDISNAPYRNS